MGSVEDRSESGHPFICHVNLDREYRGGERQTELLVRELAGRGWSQRLVLRAGAVLAQRVTDVPGLEVRFCSGLLSAARQIGTPDLVHVHQGRAMYPAYLRKLFSQVPYIITRRVPNLPGSGWLTRAAYAGASRLVAVSAAVAGTLSEALSVPRESISIIADSFQPQHGDRGEVRRLREQWGGEFIVGHIGSLDHQTKGQGDLIRVARQFAATQPGIHFVLVGAGRDEAQFKEQSQGLENLHFTGFQDRVGDYLAAFDLFAFPSLKEGMGSVLLDAMDHSLAVVASDVGGIPELVADGETGVLVPASDPHGLAQAILKLYQDPECRRAMGQAGKQRSRLFTAPVMAERYIRIYDDVLA